MSGAVQRRARGPSSTNFGSTLEVSSFTEARKAELAKLRIAALQVHGNRRVYQQLSWHLRRRTMSHTSRRVPARLRVEHARELQSQKPVAPRSIGARRLRKYRRKARFLNALRKLRCKLPTRLETHLWHVKRFHMTKLPAHSAHKLVPLHPNDRGIRSAYRAVSHACVAHDASYMSLISVNATFSALKNALAYALLPAHLPRVLTDPVTQGMRVVRGVLIVDMHASRALAPVDLLWRPRSLNDESDDACIWLWIHPAAAEVVLKLFRNDAAVQVVQLHEQICTLSLFGPRSGHVLGAVLHEVQFERALKSDLDSTNLSWDCLRYMRSPACAPPDAVLCGQVSDPRQSFPPKRVHAMASRSETFMQSLNERLGTGSAFNCSCITSSAQSIWSESCRSECRKFMLKKGKEQKAHMSKHGSFKVPFMLIQRSSALSRGFASGWDLIIPGAWGMPFWQSIMYANGARAIGLREVQHCNIEVGLPTFPYDFPDSPPAFEMLRKEERDAMEKHLRKPKAKRVDYQIYRIHSPFFPDPLPPNSGIHAGASSNTLAAILLASSATVLPPARKRRRPPPSPLVQAPAPAFRVVRDRFELRALLFDGLETKEHDVDQDKLFARAVLRPIGRGSISANALISLPKEEDLRAMEAERGKYRGCREIEARRAQRGRPPTRETIGRVTLGAYSLARGEPVASALVNVNAVKMLQKMPNSTPGKRRGASNRNESLLQVRVLFRNVNSLYYHAAVATIRF